jgi:hypothetical protein
MERKTTYIFNPILMPMFSGNVAEIRHSLPLILKPGSYSEKIKDDFLNYNVMANKYHTDGTMNGTEEKPIAGFFPSGFDPTSLYGLLYGARHAEYIEEEIKKVFDKNTNKYVDQTFVRDKYTPAKADQILKKLFEDYGLATVNAIIMENHHQQCLNVLDIIENVCCVFLIGFIIKYGMFDILVSMIKNVVGDSSEANGGWTTDKIYSYFEAFYINENINGMIEYLSENVLHKNSNILEQPDAIQNIDFRKVVDKAYDFVDEHYMLYFLADNNVRMRNTIKLQKKYVIPSYYFDNDNDPNHQDDIQKLFLETGMRDQNDEYVRFKQSSYGNLVSQLKYITPFINKGTYNSNKIFRKNNKPCTKNSNVVNIINPDNVIDPTKPAYVQEKNRPLIYDFMEPYQQKISFYQVIYVVSNTGLLYNSEDQIDVLNSMMPFINNAQPSNKKSRCINRK